MARLPIPGGDNNTWGNVLNDFLDVEHNADGSQKTLPVSKGGTGATDVATARSNIGAADDSAVVHQAGTETITGDKDFTGVVTKNGTNLITKLGDAADAAISSPASGDTLSYDPTSGKWKNGNGGSLPDLVLSAAGDGTTDDSAAIKTFEAAIATAAASGPVWALIPHGTYRFAQQSPAGAAALLIDALDDVTLEFAPSAKILMDNLDGSNHGTSDGILVLGSGDNVTILNPDVEWVSGAVRSSQGDGIKFIGYPSDSAPASGWLGSTGTLTHPKVVNPVVKNAPQAGVIFLGCSDPEVENSLVDSNLADGLHFNACRRPKINGHRAINTGDDGLAFVTYYDASDVWRDATWGPFNQPSLGEWSNKGGSFSSVVVDGGTANGLRLAGCLDVSGRVDEILNKTAAAGVICDAGLAGGSYTWGYQASKGCRVEVGSIDTCAIGVQVRVFNVDRGDDASFWTFDVEISADIANCSAESVYTQGNGSANSGPTGVNFHHIKARGAPCYFHSLQSCSLIDIECDEAIQVYGNDVSVSPLSSLIENDLVVDNVRSIGGSVSFQDLRGVSIGVIRSSNASGSGVTFTRCTDITFVRADVAFPNRSNTGTNYGMLLNKVQRIKGELRLRTDANNGGTWASVSLGGGDSTDVSNEVDIAVVYRNTLNQATDDVTVQSGTYKPTSYFLPIRFYNGGESTPVWRYTKHYASIGWSVAAPASRADIMAVARGLIAETFPLADTAAQTLTSQLTFATLIGLRQGEIVTDIVFCLNQLATGTAPTLAKFGIYDSSGNCVAVTADQSGTTALTGSTGYVGVAISGGPWVCPADGGYYIVALINGSFGTQQPTLLRDNATNAPMASAYNSKARTSAQFGTTNTDLPTVGSAAPAIGANGTRIWFGLS